MELLLVPVSVLLVMEYKHIYHFVVEYRLTFSLFFLLLLWLLLVFYLQNLSQVVYHRYVGHPNYIKCITINNWLLRAYVQLHVCV